MNRRESREAVFTLLYEREFHPDEDQREVYALALESREIPENPYIERTYFGICSRLCEIDAMIGEYAKGWRVDRLSKVSAAILRLGIYELLWAGDDVPTPVAINEAIELAKRYDIDSAPAFVNGILNKIAHVAGKIGKKDDQPDASAEEQKSHA